MICRASALVLTISLLAACAAPNVDREAIGFDNESYFTDLNECQGGSAFQAALETTGVGLEGSVEGAFNGLFLGLVTGEGAVDMLVGAIVGATVGIGIGAVASVS